MTYMNQNDFDMPNGIQEMNFDEIDNVDGGLGPLAIIGIGLAAVAVVGVVVGFVGEHNRDVNDAKEAETSAS